MDRLPGTVSELLRALDKAYPARQPRPQDTPAEVMYRAGARSVVDQLLHLRDHPPQD
ncbi:MAG: hypothetical protein ACR2N5_00935 [Solirubrobacterales bacterium]